MREIIGYGILFVFGFTVLILAIALPIRGLSHYYDKKYCPVKLEALGREGKFVDYNFWDWNCLVQNDNGSYVTIDRLLNVSEDS